MASADNIDSIVAATAPDPEDDVAVLLVSFVEAPATLVLEIPADPREIRGLRRRVHAWLTQHNVEEATQQAAVLALNEACANAIEHAYRDADAGTISIELTQHEKALSIIVEDHGSWREPAHDPNRGRGIFSCETSWRRRRSSVVAEAPASYSRPRSDADPYVVRAAQEPEPAAERFLGARLAGPQVRSPMSDDALFDAVSWREGIVASRNADPVSVAEKNANSYG